MDRLLPELRDQVISCYTGPSGWMPLTPLSVISRAWRDSVERVNFNTLSISSADLEHFSRIVVGPRRTALTRLTFVALLPSYPEASDREPENDSDRAANNIAATACVSKLFAVLNTWGAGGELDLSLAFQSLSDGRTLDLRGGGEKRYQYSVLRLHDPSRFPEVRCVTSLNVGTPRRHPEPCDLLGLTHRLPRVRSVLWIIPERGFFPMLRRDVHSRFALAAKAHSFRLPASTLYLNLSHRAPYFLHNTRLPNLSGQLDEDDVYSAIRRLSTSAPLKEFQFEGMAGPSLFWPGPDEDAPEPFWPALEDLRLDLSLQSPSGQWYFKFRASQPYDLHDFHDPREVDVPLPDDIFALQPPGYAAADDQRGRAADFVRLMPSEYGFDKDYSERFRTRPDDTLMAALLESFAKALGRMPTLKSAFLKFDAPDYMFLSFAAPGHVTVDSILQGEAPPIGAPRLFVYLQGWRMGSELERVFREEGKRVHRVEMVVRHLDDDDLFYG